jgi:hypothetical protein
VISTGVPIGVVPVLTLYNHPSVGLISLRISSSNLGVSSTNNWVKSHPWMFESGQLKIVSFC